MSYKKGVHNSYRNQGLGSTLGRKPERIASGSIGHMVKRIKDDVDWNAQHGPVKVLWRNGKPVGQQP